MCPRYEAFYIIYFPQCNVLNNLCSSYGKFILSKGITRSNLSDTDQILFHSPLFKNFHLTSMHIDMHSTPCHEKNINKIKKVNC